MIDLQKIKNLARNIVKRDVQTLDEFVIFIEIWWSSYYKLPSNHPLFGERTIEEHALDYYVKSFMDDPDSLSKQTVEDLEADEAWMKKELKDDFQEEYDSLLGTDMSDEEFDAIIKEIEEDKVRKVMGLDKEEKVEFDDDFGSDEGLDGEE